MHRFTNTKSNLNSIQYVNFPHNVYMCTMCAMCMLFVKLAVFFPSLLTYTSISNALKMDRAFAHLSDKYMSGSSGKWFIFQNKWTPTFFFLSSKFYLESEDFFVFRFNYMDLIVRFVLFKSAGINYWWPTGMVSTHGKFEYIDEEWREIKTLLNGKINSSLLNNQLINVFFFHKLEM